VYFQNDEKKTDTLVKTGNFNFKYQANDIVSITVSCSEPELSKPFNNNILSIRSQAQDGYENGQGQDGYLINEAGFISFPVLGQLKLAGLSRVEALNLLTNELKKYINDPIVMIRVLNFRVTVLGSVNRPGVYTIPNERMTILDALALANDLKITGLRKNVKLVRKQDGIKKTFELDLTSIEFFQSQAYYLQQNDIIYVEPNLQERYSSTIFKNTFITAISAFTVILTALNIIVSQ
jgi:polysaccharide biosynthesis/export protein